MGEAGFTIWKKRLDNRFAKEFGGMVSDDFEDFGWRDFYEDGLTVAEAFDEWYQIAVIQGGY